MTFFGVAAFRLSLWTVVLTFDDGTELHFVDARKFGRIYYFATGDTPIYVRVTLENGHQAWSSPIYLFRHH